MGVVIGGVVRDYDWGRIDGLTDFGVPPTGRPQAELWFGDHRSGPSPIMRRVDGGLSAPDLLTANGDSPSGLLGKILAIARPLSIQVHPPSASIAQLQELAPHSLVDLVAKHEAVLALQPSDALCGWRSQDHIDLVVQAWQARGRAIEQGGAIDVAESLQRLWSHDPHGFARDAAIVAKALDDEARSVFALLSSLDPLDAGVGLAMLLQLHRLAPGEVLAVPAGTPHAYLSGLVFEVMCPSDNVFRLGLTPKPVDAERAFACIRAAHPVEPQRLQAPAQLSMAGEVTMRVSLTGSDPIDLPDGDSLVIAARGEIVVDLGSAVECLAPGEALFVRSQGNASDQRISVRSPEGLGVVMSMSKVVGHA